MRAIRLSRRGLAAVAAVAAAALLPLTRAFAAPRPRVRIAAASDLRFVLPALDALLARRRPEIRVEATFGSSGTFFAQLSSGAPFDLFLSADVDYPEKLRESGLSHDGTVFRYAIGRLAVWVRNESPLALGSDPLRALADAAVRHVAIANPRHAPYGRAAESALRSAGAYEAVAPKLVLGESVSQAAQMVESGAAEAGLVSLSLALAPAMRASGRHAVVPASAHPPIAQGGVILKGAGDPAAAAAYRDLLLGAEGRETLATCGFDLPPR